MEKIKQSILKHQENEEKVKTIQMRRNNRYSPIGVIESKLV